MVVGPLDKRARKTRCRDCARRRIKVCTLHKYPCWKPQALLFQCEGGPPCMYCTKRGFKCTPQVTINHAGLFFINQAPGARGFDGSHFGTHHPTPVLCSSIAQDTTSRFTNHFFSGFLVRNDFAVGPLDLDTITSQFQSTASLYHASIAVGALDYANAVPSFGIEKRAAKMKALDSYRTSVVKFQTEIQCTRIQQSDACLWTTLFLGLFEVP